VETFKHKVKDGTELHAYRWTPTGEPRATIYLAHGMGEHAARYERTGKKLAEQGYLVIANDHRGHGRTAKMLGDFGTDGWNRTIDDIFQMMQTYSTQGKPRILIGHSMGAMLSQQFVTRYGFSLDALVLSGSPGFSPTLVNWITRMLCWIENKRLGPLKESALLSSLIFGSANKPFEADNPAASGFEWLSRDAAEVQKYIDDDLCGFVPFPASLGEIFAGASTSQDKHQIRDIPQDLPIYVFSGTADPVHGELKNINRLLNAWRGRGLTTTTKFYADGRHEMLNETNRDEVISNLIAWLDNLDFAS
jgi:alpha-beta hydrolase superfamily lysophospholipase